MKKARAKNWGVVWQMQTGQAFVNQKKWVQKSAIKNNGSKLATTHWTKRTLPICRLDNGRERAEQKSCPIKWQQQQQQQQQCHNN